jgi:type IV pilus assembly protein PilV
MEVLISLFVVAIGMLGNATLQVSSKRMNLEARERTTATHIAQDLLERMRVNGRSLAIYTNDGAGVVLDGTSLAAVNCDAACTEEQMADYDLYLSELAVQGISTRIGTSSVAGLTAPTICVDGPAGGSGIYTVSIAWRSRTQLSNPAGVSDCGEGSGLYDTADGSGADVHRRVLGVTTFIAEPI